MNVTISSRKTHRIKQTCKNTCLEADLEKYNSCLKTQKRGFLLHYFHNVRQQSRFYDGIAFQKETEINK